MNMRKFYLLTLLAFLPLLANADAVEIDGIYYNLNAETHKAEVTSNPNKYSGEVTVPASITYNATVYSVTAIGELAFFCCEDLHKVNIPSTVSVIGLDAFFECSSLEEITLPEGLTAIEGGTFMECSSLKNVIIPSTVTRIGDNPGAQSDGPFNGCPLETLFVPASVQTIGPGGLWATPNTIIIMESATPPSSIDNLALEDALHYHVFSKIIVPDGSKNAYQNANVWKKYSDDILEMSESSVRIFKGVEAGTLPTLISDEVKYTIDHLKITGSLNGTDIRLLRDMAGNNYQGQLTNGQLKYLDISDANIVAGGERYLDTTEGVVYSNQTTIPGTFQFGTENNVIGESMFISCQKLEEILLPHSITTIVAKSFMLCKELKSFVLPENVSSILGGGGFIYATDKLGKLNVASGNKTFSSSANSNAIMQGTKLIRGCNNTIIPSETTIIGECAFMACAISSVTLPETIVSIEMDAFNSCWNLATIMVKGATPIVIDNSVFSGCNANATLLVPEGCKSAYEAAAYWKNFKIEEFSLPKAKAGLAYTGAAQDLITASSFQTMKYSLTDNNYSSSIPQGKDAKEYTVYYKDTEYNLSGSIKVSIAPKEVSNPRIVLFSTAFSLNEDDNHDPIEPEVLYVFDGDVSIPETEYTVCYSNNTNVGTATVTITDKAGGNYNVSGSATFTIGRTIAFGESYKWKDYVAKEDLMVPSGLSAYVITSLGTSSAIASQIDYIPKGVPVLLNRESSFTDSFFAEPGSGTTPTTNLLKAYTTAKEVSDQEGYILYKDEFVLVSAGTLPAGRAFLPANGSGNASTRSIVFDDEGTTGVHSSMREVDDANDQWYDLQGRRLEGKPIKKGLYILNGRKVVVK